MAYDVVSMDLDFILSTLFLYHLVPSSIHYSGSIFVLSRI